MLLVIDVGNTHTVFGLYDGSRLSHHFRISTERHRTDDECGVLLGALLREASVVVEAISAVAIASVVPPLTGVFASMCRRRLPGLTVQPLVIGPGVKTGMPIQCENPREVGADRIVNAVAGYQWCRRGGGAAGAVGPVSGMGTGSSLATGAGSLGGGAVAPRGCIVVDFGTATTFDVVSVDGAYLGGAIAPGVNTAAESLFAQASKLPRIDLTFPSSVIGRTTVTSMQSGILFGYAAMVDGMVHRMRAELAFPVNVVATGGLARVVAEHAQAVDAVEDFLTLEGLRIIHKRNFGPQETGG